MSADASHVLVGTADRVMEVRLNRPDKRNALTRAMYGAIADALLAAEADPGIRCVLLCAEGEVFCAGNDLNDFLADQSGIGDRPQGRFLRALTGAKKILVAAVQGSAVGVGTTMLLHCDLILAAQGASFSVPFVRLGVTPEAGSSALLPAALGRQRAMEHFLLGEPFSAELAHACGMVNRIVEPARLGTAARELARAIADLPPEAVCEAKRLVRLDAPLAERMAEEEAVFSKCLRSAEAKEAMAAFFEKRAPRSD
jgi:enoyl-CoA hydratase/carnithine racemase